MSETSEQTQPTPDSPYNLGWNDGYAEGYGAKLVDVGQLWMPAGTAREIEAMADYLMRKHALVFTIRAEAIGVARGMMKAAKDASNAQNKTTTEALLAAIDNLLDWQVYIAAKAKPDDLREWIKRVKELKRVVTEVRGQTK